MPRRPTSRSPFRPSRARPREIASDQIFRTSPTGTPGPTGPQGDPGVDGSTAGLLYLWSSSTSEADPGSGKVGINGTATKMFISEVDREARGMGGFLATADDSTSTVRGHVLIRKDNDPSTFVLLSLTGALTDNGTWDTFPTSILTFGGSLANNDEVSVTFLRTGDKGDQGDPGADGADGVGVTHYGLVTSLPGSPSDGERCTFTDDLTTPTYAWELLYVAARASYKWQVVGGSPIIVRSDTQRDLTNQTSYTNLPTDPASITVPLAGDYDVGIGAYILNASNPNGGAGSISYAVGGTAADDAKAAGNLLLQYLDASSVWNESRVNGIAASTAIAEKAKTGGNYTVQFHRRRLSVMPVRVG